MRFSPALLLIPAILFLQSSPAPAQLETVVQQLTQPEKNETPAEDAKAKPAAQPTSLRNPRATMRVFRELTAKRDYAAAAECLDFSEGAPAASQRGDAAFYLQEILNCLPPVKLSEISADPDGSVYHYQPNQTFSPIEIARQPDGRWLFSARTVAEIPELKKETNALASAHNRTWLGRLLPAWWFETAFLLPNGKWISLLGVILIGVIADMIARFALLRLLIAWFKLRKIKMDESSEQRVCKPVGLLVRACVWYAGTVLIGFPPSILAVILVAVKVFAVVAGIWTAWLLIDMLTQYLLRRASKTATKFDDLFVPLVSRSLKVFVFCVGLVSFAQAFDLPIAGLVSGLGIGGLAIAFAAKDTIANVFGSLTILGDRPFEIGDWVVLDNAEGSVETVGIRSTRIRTFYNSVISVPNSQLMTAVIDNMGRRRYRRFKTHLGLQYGTPPDRIEAFCEGVRELIRLHPYTRKDYFHVYLNQFSASSIDILLYVFWECPDWSTELQERERLLLDILRLAPKVGVSFAFPTQTLHFAPRGGEKETPETLTDPYEAGRNAAGEIVPDAT